MPKGIKKFTDEDEVRSLGWIAVHPKASYLEFCKGMGFEPEAVVPHTRYYEWVKRVHDAERPRDGHHKEGGLLKPTKEEVEKMNIGDFEFGDSKKVEAAKKEMEKAIDNSYELYGKIAEQEKIIYELRKELAVKEATPPEMLPADTEKLEELKSELEKMQAICKQIEAERDFYVGEDNDYKTKCAELETQLKNAEAELEGLKPKHEKALARCKALAVELNNAYGEIDSLRTGIKNAEAGQEFAENELEGFKAKVENANNEDLQAALDAANDELHNALEKIKDQQITIDGLERCKALVQDERNELEVKYEELHNEYNGIMIDIARHAMKEW